MPLSTIRIVVLAFGLIAPNAFADTYPDRTVRLIVPVAPGGSMDTTARVIGDALSKRWGQPVIIDNRPGANLIRGTEAAAKASPDGYTLLVTGAGSMAMNVALVPNLPYDPLRDFAPVAMISSLPYMLMVHDSVPARTAEELIQYAKRHPGKLNNAAGGPAAELAAALFKRMAGVDIVDIPYKGASPAVQSLIAGQTQLCFADTATTGVDSPHIRILAVTSPNRVALFPNVPTLAESAIPGFEYVAWIGLFAPEHTPAPIRTKIESDLQQVLGEPALRARLEAMRMEVNAIPGAALRKRIEAEIGSWTTLVKETGLKLR